MKKGLFLMGIGAGLMYLLDPEKGGTRRAQLRDCFESFMPQTKDALSSKVEEVAAKAHEITEKVDSVAAEKVENLGGDVVSPTQPPELGHS